PHSRVLAHLEVRNLQPRVVLGHREEPLQQGTRHVGAIAHDELVTVHVAQTGGVLVPGAPWRMCVGVLDAQDQIGQGYHVTPTVPGMSSRRMVRPLEGGGHMLKALRLRLLPCVDATCFMLHSPRPFGGAGSMLLAGLPS